MGKFDFFRCFLLFIIYSNIGWLIEVVKTKFDDKKWVNRGFLIGPYCPIYGISAIVMVNYLTHYKGDIVTIFILALFICSVAEYMTSYVMEKLFNTRWWDYTDEKFNLEGRICLKNCFYFGLLGVLLVYVVNPMFVRILNNINDGNLRIIGIFALVYFIFDYILSFWLISKLKDNYNIELKDMTEDLTKERKNILRKEKRKLQKRIIKAFPNLKPIIKK